MATQIKKTGSFPAVSVTYDNTYKLSDDVTGKFISLNGAKKFYNPGIGLQLQSPSSGSTTVITNDTATLTLSAYPAGTNLINIRGTLSKTLGFDLKVTCYLNYTVNGVNGGTGVQNFTIANGQSSNILILNSTTNTSQISNYSPVITNLVSGTTTLNWTYGSTNAIGVMTFSNTQTVATTGVFTNTLNIPDFQISYINFYGANRDTLILKNNKLTS